MATNHMSLLHTPTFWDPDKAYRDYAPDTEGAMLEGRAFGRKHGLKSPRTS